MSGGLHYTCKKKQNNGEKMKRLIWTGHQSLLIVKFMGIDATCGEAIVDFGEGDFEWLPISELKCFTSGKPLSEMLKEAA